MSGPDKKNMQNIKVYIRQRPFTKCEVEQRCVNAVANISPREILMKSGFTQKKYNFNHVFGDSASQQEVYQVAVAPMIGSIIAGYNCTVFAYGQTGTGKTHTIFGELKTGPDVDYKKDPSVGLISRAADHLFAELSKLNVKSEYTVRVSLLEIYNEEVRDLFNDCLALRVYDDPLNKGSVCIKDMSKITVFNTRDLHDWLSLGLNERQNAASNSNVLSSRCHTIFTFSVNVREVTSRGEEIIKTGRLHLIDMAGSENSTRPGGSDVRAREAGSINRSIITIGKVIKALAQKKQHIPYRDSKLTRILQDSLGGNTKTSMIATFSANSLSWDETINTLELAHITRSILNNPQVNVNRKQANLLQELHGELTKLKEELAAARGSEGFYVSAEAYARMTEDFETNNQKIPQLLRQVREAEQHLDSLKQQYTNTHESFEKTKHYLNTMKKQLEEKQKIVKLKHTQMNNLNEKHKELSDTASALLNVCENSTKHEEIYHNKFQEKCLANTNNTKVSKEMVSTALATFDDIQNANQTRLQQQTSRINTSKQASVSLRSRHIPDFKKIDSLTAQIIQHGRSYELQLQEMLKHPENIRPENVRSFVNRIYQSSFSDVKLQAGLRNSMQNLRRNAETHMMEIQATSLQCFSTLKDNLRRKEEETQRSVDVLMNISVLLEEREKRILIQRQRDHEMIVNARREHRRAQQQEHELAAEVPVVGRGMTQVCTLMDQNRNTQPMRQARACLGRYMQSSSAMIQEQRSPINNVIHDVRDIEREMQSRAVADKARINQQVNTMVAAAQENMTLANTGYRRAIRGLGGSMEDFRENLIPAAAKTTAALENDFNQLTETENMHNDLIRKYVEESMRILESFKQTVNSLGHVGDTPAKQTRVIPKKPEGLPNGILFDTEDDTDQTKKTGEESDEDNS